MKLGLAGLLVAVVAVAVLLIAPTTSGAGNGAVFETGYLCGFLDGNGDLAVTSNPTKTVYAPDGSWNETCKAKGVPNDTGSSVIWNYDNTSLACSDAVNGYFTYDWQVTISKSGNATLTCHFDATLI